MKTNKQKFPSCIQSNFLGEQLSLWLGVLDDLNKTKPEMDKFEKKICNMIQTRMLALHEDILAALKELEKETGDDWSSYLETFDIHEWTPGDFQKSIINWLKEEIRAEALKLT